MRRLALAEHTPARGVRLTRAERDALHTTIPELAISPSHGQDAGPGRFDLTPGSWVGVAAPAPTLLVEIAPKLPVSRVLFLLSYARDPRSWRVGSSAPLQERDDLVETVVALFCEDLRRALRFGLLHGYALREAALLTVRGRFLPEAQLRRRPGQALPAGCAYDELTADVPENRLLKAALIRAAQLPGCAGLARQLLPAFEEVTVEPLSSGPLQTIEHTRLNAHYRPALELARLILAGAGLEARGGRTIAPSILFDMDRIFEDFVVAALRQALGLTEGTFPSAGARRGRGLTLDHAETVPLEPDLSWWSGGRCLFVGDVKYKHTARGESADLYQLLAYATAAGLPGGLLVYASGEDSTQRELVHQVRHAGKALHIATLDLAAPPRALLAQIQEVAKLARRLAHSPGRRSAA